MSIQVHVIHDRLERRRKTRQERGLEIESIAGKHLVHKKRHKIARVESRLVVAVAQKGGPLNVHLGDLRERVLTGTFSRMIYHDFLTSNFDF